MVIDKQLNDLTILIDEKQVQNGVLKLAEEINAAFPENEPLYYLLSTAAK